MIEYLKPTTVCGLHLKNPLMNASGVISDTPYALKLWDEAGVGALVSKSFTVLAREPNKFDWTTNPPRLIMIRGPDYTINSIGLPNKGLFYRKIEFEKFFDRNKFNSPLIISVSTGTGNFSEYPLMICELEPITNMFEVNVSCPNTGKQIIGLNMDSLESVLRELSTEKPLSIKLPPYADQSSLKKVVLDFDEVGQYFLEQKAVTYVPTRLDEKLLCEAIDLIEFYGVKCVTSQNTLLTKHSLLGPPVGGLSGRPIHEFAVMQAQFISDHSSLDIIASGGVLNYKDVIEFLQIKNVKAVQLGSGVFQYDMPLLFVQKIISGLSESL